MKESRLQTYLIYGRTTYTEPLEYVDKVVTAEDVRQLPMKAEDRWVELVAIPETAVIHVIPMDGKVR